MSGNLGRLGRGFIRPATALVAGFAAYKLAQREAHSIASRVEVLPHVNTAVFASTRATSLQPTIDAIEDGSLNASISFLMSNNPEAYALKRAAKHGIHAVHYPEVDSNGKKRPSREFYAPVLELLESDKVEIVLCVGYKKIIPGWLVDQWADRMLNVHPSLLPLHKGKFDLEVHQEVLDAGEKESGCTIHIITKEVDSGPPIIQLRCPVLPGDTAETLKDRVQALEGPAFVQAIKMYALQKLEKLSNAEFEQLKQEALASGLKRGMERVAMRNCPF